MSARGKVRSGSRTSPANLLKSHQPPNEKNAPTMPPANAPNKASDPGRWATNGVKLDQCPALSPKPQKITKASNPSLRMVSQRIIQPPSRTPRMFTKATNRIEPMAPALRPDDESPKMYPT